MYNLPNLLTISRIVVIPLIFVSVYINDTFWGMLAAVLFVAASVTDYFDGYLARAWNETSAFGRLLDPIADKLLVATALVVILVKKTADGEDMYSLSLTIIPAFVILCREILVSGLREFLREVNVGLPVTRLAKWKTGFQMTALSMMLFRELWIGWSYLGEFLLWVAAVLTFITGYQYYQKSLDYIKAEEAKKIKVIPAAEKTTVAEKVASGTLKKVKASSKAKKTATKKNTAKKSTKKNSEPKKNNVKSKVSTKA